MRASLSEQLSQAGGAGELQVSGLRQELLAKWEASAAATASQLSQLQSAEADLVGQLQQLGSQVGELQSGTTAAAAAVDSLQKQVESLSSACTGGVSRPALVIELDLVRKEIQEAAAAGRADAAAQAAALSSSLQQAQAALRSEFDDKLNETELALTGRVQSDLAGKAAAASQLEAQLEGLRSEWLAAVESSGAAAAAQLELLQQQLAALATAQQAQGRELLEQAAAAAGSALTERLGAFKASLLAELEGGLLGAWGSQLKVAAAAEAAQQVDARLKANEQRLREAQAALLEQKLAGAVGGEVAARLQELKEELRQQVAAKAAADAAEAYASTKKEMTSGLEKKMHAALDAALVTLKTEAAETAKRAAAAHAAQLAAAGGGSAAAGGSAEVAAAVGELQRDFEDMRGAIKRNAQWLLQAPA
ncbi:hypothetical protein OEZ86_002146 [Tetradesmus obliquus]|nr:hypothetical protein OEZ86_002146 [Tetradesmus obliquus]